jgi:hypothetical protein
MHARRHNLPCHDVRRTKVANITIRFNPLLTATLPKGSFKLPITFEDRLKEGFAGHEP